MNPLIGFALACLVVAALAVWIGFWAIVWKDGPADCPICKENEWNVLDQVRATLHDDVTQMHVFVPVVCLGCGYTFFMHAKQLAEAADA